MGQLRSGFGVLALTAGMLALPGASSAQVPPRAFVDILFDENCNGHFLGSFSALRCSFQNDTGPGGLNHVMFYPIIFPPDLIAGDLRIFEPGNSGPVLSDVLRFDPIQLAGGIFVYSAQEVNGLNAPADIGFPTAFSANVLDVLEVGSEFNSGFRYTPLPGQPGNVSGVPNTQVTYWFFSDTPEPGTIGLMVGGSILLYWRRRQA
jgi:hypothetical protein